jgi:hypothetical protein
MSADCEACWQASGAEDGHASTMRARLDCAVRARGAAGRRVGDGSHSTGARVDGRRHAAAASIAVARRCAKPAHCRRAGVEQLCRRTTHGGPAGRAAGRGAGLRRTGGTRARRQRRLGRDAPTGAFRGRPVVAQRHAATGTNHESSIEATAESGSLCNPHDYGNIIYPPL